MRKQKETSARIGRSLRARRLTLGFWQSQLSDLSGWFPSNIVGQLRSELAASNIVTDAVTGEKVIVIDAGQGTASQFKKHFRKSIRIVKDLNHDQIEAADEGGGAIE